MEQHQDHPLVEQLLQQGEPKFRLVHGIPLVSPGNLNSGRSPRLDFPAGAVVDAGQDGIPSQIDETSVTEAEPGAYGVPKGDNQRDLDEFLAAEESRRRARFFSKLHLPNFTPFSKLIDRVVSYVNEPGRFDGLTQHLNEVYAGDWTEPYSEDGIDDRIIAFEKLPDETGSEFPGRTSAAATDDTSEADTQSRRRFVPRRPEFTRYNSPEWAGNQSLWTPLGRKVLLGSAIITASALIFGSWEAFKPDSTSQAATTGSHNPNHRNKMTTLRCIELALGAEWHCGKDGKWVVTLNNVLNEPVSTVNLQGPDGTTYKNQPINTRLRLDDPVDRIVKIKVDPSHNGGANDVRLRVRRLPAN